MKRFAVFAMLLVACTKQDGGLDVAGPAMSLTAPMIQITTPRDFQRFRAGQTVSITATITDNNQLQKVRLIVNRANGTQVLRLEKSLDVKSYALSESFTMMTGPQYNIRIEAVDQHNNNTITRIAVSCR